MPNQTYALGVIITKPIVIQAPDMLYHPEKKLNTFFCLRNNFTEKLKNSFFHEEFYQLYHL